MNLLDRSELHVWFDAPRRPGAPRRPRDRLLVEEGERFGLVGESGCGKTTAILALMGLLPPNASRRRPGPVGGENLLERGEESVAPHRWREISMVFQGAMNAFNPVRTIGDQIVEPMELYDVAEGKERSLARASCSRSSAFRATASPTIRTSSRAACGSARRSRWHWPASRKCLLADEPTTALDVMVQAQILELLISLSNDFGLAVILVTHDLPVVAQVCDRAAVMYAGIVAELGSVDRLYHDPRHPYTRLLFAATPDLYGSDDVASIPGAPPRLDRELGLSLRRPAATARSPRARLSRPVFSRWSRATWPPATSTTAVVEGLVTDSGGDERRTILEVEGLVVRYPISRGIVGAAPARPKAQRVMR